MDRHPMADALISSALRKPAPPEEKGEEPTAGDPLGDAVQDLFAAMKGDDVEAGKAALTVIFQMLDSEPHEEGPDEAAE